MTRFWPTPLDVLEYNTVGMALYAMSAMLGVAGGFALGRRSAHRLLFVLVAGLFAVAATLHLAVVATLMRDPGRDLGSIPLSPLVAEGATWLSIAFSLLSPGLATFVVTRVLLAFPRFPRPCVSPPLL